ncbi:hypothetical protein EVAR_70171_1 [Eumeta japonica]|uniref:Uncharacterized protein n=1 Tax=Eumeta variegata TaxID=151549 RepID=A0A4C1SMH2_EUMVA|nr:hypothetical protein EVAR_70171_1 [Eumeta japonica]
MKINDHYGAPCPRTLLMPDVGRRFSTPNLPLQTTRQRTDWAAFQMFLETLHLGSSFAIADNMDTVANQLVNKIRRGQATATTLLPISAAKALLPVHQSVHTYIRDCQPCKSSLLQCSSSSRGC